DAFRHGLDRLREGATRYRVAFMCAEREPLDCHRALLIARHLKDLSIQHILADGTLEAQDAVERRLVEAMDEAPPPLMASDPKAWEEATERAYDARTAKWARGRTPKKA